MGERNNQIEKYLQGKLSPSEMHELEKRALSDAFLRDALEGSAHISDEAFLDDVRLLNHRIKGNKGSRLFTPLRIAAGIVLVAAMGSLFFLINKEQSKPLLTLDTSKASENKEALPPKDTLPTGSTPSETKSTEERHLSLNKPNIPPKSEPAIPKKKETDSFAGAGPDEAEKIASTTDGLVQSAGQAGEDQLKTAEIAVADRQLTQSKALARHEETNAPVPAGAVVTTKTIEGHVASESGESLPGVTVQLKGTTLGTVTDANGNYSIESPFPQPELVFSFVGMQTNEVSAKDKTTVNVVLTEDFAQLSEVVVTGQRAYTEESKAPVIKQAEPFGGLKAYDKYLEKNLRYPVEALEKKIKGRVTIEFTVYTDGSLNDFNVIKSLGYGCDEEVIRLVKEGPKWFPSTEDDVAIESNVRVRMKFDPAKAEQ